MWEEFDSYYLYDAEQKSEDWLQVRIGRITGSNVGTILDHNPFKTCDQALLEICGIKKPNLDNNEHIIRGNIYEPIVRQYYENISKYQVKEVGFALSKINNYIGGSSDGIVQNFKEIELDGIIEIKVPNSIYSELLRRRHKKYIQPLHYDQMQWTMGILKKNWCDYIVASTKDKICVINRVPFNENYFKKMVNQAGVIIETKLIPLIEKYNIKLLNPIN